METAGPSKAALDLRGKFKRDNMLEMNPPKSSWEKEVHESIELMSTFPFLKEFVNFSFIAYKNMGEVESRVNPAVAFNIKDLIEVEKALAGVEVSQKPSPTHSGFRITSLNRFSRNTGSLMTHFKTKGKYVALKQEEICPVDISKVAGVPEGFEFLVEANNRSTGNGYHGVAFIQRNKKQIIVSHRGTKLSSFGALKTDLKSICFNSHTPQVSSAMTFAHEVNIFAKETGCQIFFTGHSLGAWLAQITCFSTKFLTVDENTGHFVRKIPEFWDDSHPYTVVFDSPGAYEFLIKMKDDLFPRNDTPSQEINVSCLPVEIFQFSPNSVNQQNIQIGSVFLVDLDKAEVEYSYSLVSLNVGNTEVKVDKPFFKKTHALEPVKNFVSQNAGVSEKEVLRSRVVDFRIENWDDFLHKWEKEGRSVPVQLNSFPWFFLTKEELEVLKSQKYKKEGGCYEGICLEDEEVANKMVENSRVNKIVDNGMVLLGIKMDRREIIPLLRHFTGTLRNKKIWWNPNKPSLPGNYIDRTFRRTDKLDSEYDDVEDLFPQDHSEASTSPVDKISPTLEDSSIFTHEDETVPMDEGTPCPSPDDNDFIPVSSKSERTPSFEEDEAFFLLVDPPGMGKSTQFTRLEISLRKSNTRNRIILRVNLNEVQRKLSSISSSESASSVLLKLAPFLPENAFERKSIGIFVLLDGLDEVCPKHEKTMLTLLHILKSDTNLGFRDIAVSTRPHLKEAMESEFHLKSWSLAPLSLEEQMYYIENTLKISDEQSIDFWNELPVSICSLLTNPLMLSMLVDVLKLGGTFSAQNVNIYELYTSFVEMKHKLQLVEKEKMGPEDSVTETRLESMLERNLPFYFHVAWKERNLSESSQDTQLSNNKMSPFHKSIGVIARKPSSRSIINELLTYGLLLNNPEKGLVFKHRSLAEFFYVKLLTHDETPQVVRDGLFGRLIYKLDFSNVEDFLVASLSKTAGELELNEKDYIPLLTITTNWIFSTTTRYQRCRTVVDFVKGKLFPFLAREVLLTFVRGDPEDLWVAYSVFVNSNCRYAFIKLFDWMSANNEWTREVLLDMSEDKATPQPAVRLIVAIAVTFEDQVLFSAEEVVRAMESCSNLISTVASIKDVKGWTEGIRYERSKWDFVESHVGAGRFRELTVQANDEDFFLILKDIETVWKLLATFSREELLSFISNEETRVTDVIGTGPNIVLTVLGEEFLGDLAKFRGKFKGFKGKTVFELGASDFALCYLFDDLVKETEQMLDGGAVTVALREAIGTGSSWDLFQKLEKHTKDRQTIKSSVSVLEWVVTAGGSIWDIIPSIPSSMLPFVIRYSGSLHHVQKILEQIQSEIEIQKAAEEDVKGNEENFVKNLFVSLILASCHHGESSSVFSLLLQFTKDRVQPELFAQYVENCEEEVAQAALYLRLVSDVTVEHIYFQTKPPPISPTEEFDWIEFVQWAIKFTPSYSLPAVLNKLRTRLPIEKLTEVLLHKKVFREWQNVNISKLKILIAFYLDTIGRNLDTIEHNLDTIEHNLDTIGHNLEWMKEIACLLHPVECVSVLEETSRWTHLVPYFEKVVRTNTQHSIVGTLYVSPYKTEWEWERLQQMFGDEHFPIGIARASSAEVVPLLRVLLKKFGLNETGKIANRVWNVVSVYPIKREYSLEKLAELLHIAIEMGEFEAVEKLSWPALLYWKNEKGEDALDVAKEKLAEDHPIRLLLQTRSSKLTGWIKC